MKMKRYATYITLLVALLGLAAVPAFTQGPVPLTGELDKKAPRPDLPPEALDAAREYLDVLRQLEDVMRDYANYASELDPETRAEIAEAVKKFSRGIQRGSYTSDCRLLIKDINTYVSQLQAYEAAMQSRQAQETARTQQAKVVESLRRELRVLSNLIEQDVRRNLKASSEYEQAIEAYVQAQLAQDKDQVHERRLMVELELLQDSSLQATLERVEELRTTLPEVPTPPSPPGVRVVWDQPRAPQPPKAPRPGEIGSSRTLSGYLSYGANLPINITAPAGDLILKPSGGDAVEAVLEIEVKANSRAGEKSFIEATRLEMTQDRSGYHVKAEYPKLRDPNTRLLRSILVVTIPEQAVVYCQNSFGRLVAADFEITLTAAGNHSDMLFSNMDGYLSVTNTMGAIKIQQVDGTIRAMNSYGPIELTSCDGKLTIENSYDLVSLNNCDGEAEILNSGTVKVVNHDGPLMINNQNGLVDVTRLSGDLIAFNTYQPLRISDIDGNAKLENTNALISASDITGRIVVANRYGRITITDVDGPMRLTNEFGAVDLFFNREIPPRSSVSTTSDTITVWMSPSANVLVNAETLEGNISSFFPIERSNRGERQQGIIKLGDGRNRLDLSGTYSAIVVNESR